MIIKVGDILEKVPRDYSDCEVVEIINNIVAVQFISDRSYKSYANVIAGLSLNPTKIDVKAPLYWYKKDELLTMYKLKESN